MPVRSLWLSASLYLALVLQPLANEGLVNQAMLVSLPAIITSLALFRAGPAELLLWAALAGFVNDILHAPPLGPGAAAMILTAFTVRRGLGARPAFTVSSVLAASLAVSFCSGIGGLSIRAAISGLPVRAAPLLLLTFRQAAGNGLLTLIVLLVLRAIRPARRMRAFEGRNPGTNAFSLR